MYSVRFDGKKAMKTLNNIVKYSEGFIRETKAKEGYVASRMADMSIEGFYDFLDNLARTSPGMLHHVYEWGQVGNPSARLYELKKQLTGKQSVKISSTFLPSTSVSENSSQPFTDKAEIMEEGIQIVIDEVQADALFFQVNGEEFFRSGPIVIANPGGEAVRGSFLKSFDTFYNKYFEDVYLRSINFYEYFRRPEIFAKNFGAGARGGASVGRQTALSWIRNMPGGTLNEF
jgi:hypothetical protein